MIALCRRRSVFSSETSLITDSIQTTRKLTLLRASWGPAEGIHRSACGPQAGNRQPLITMQLWLHVAIRNGSVMLNAFAPRRGSLRGLRLVSFHSSAQLSALRVNCDGIETLFRDLHDSPLGDKSDPAARAGKRLTTQKSKTSLSVIVLGTSTTLAARRHVGREAKCSVQS